MAGQLLHELDSNQGFDQMQHHLAGFDQNDYSGPRQSSPETLDRHMRFLGRLGRDGHSQAGTLESQCPPSTVTTINTSFSSGGSYHRAFTQRPGITKESGRARAASGTLL